ncbi:lymphotoxin-alpha-like [Micropterus dolomieu]|uniref:lymphotoxin-alpha-like n=1 Tax=Micropterus dolomieu TaxID=147949 RepID=UPI001E8DF34B|nr:lymphotoxin-alpha-like [Micropterus dolomieu]
MEMLDGKRLLIHEWEAGGMEEDGCCCCCGVEAGLHQQNALIQLLRQKETRLQRMARFLVAALLLLFSVALALLLTVLLGGRSHQSPDGQPKMQPHRLSSDTIIKHQQLKDDKNPSAMLTAPKGKSNNGTYLEWESESGNAFCQGGFNYSNGDLVVPRNGIYRVFLQITYESKDLNCDHVNLKLHNKVFLIQDNYNVDVLLLSSVDTVICGKGQWSKSLYTAGLFSLEANSRLHVISSQPDLIVGNEHQVFFGAELLHQ